MKNYLLLVICFVLLDLGAMSQNIRYVKPGGSGDGSSWEQASGDIQTMVTASSINDQVWVAEGMYVLTSTLQMKTGVMVYGGFTGTESSLNQRDWKLNETILDGNNSVVVLYQTSTQTDTIESVWDGFTIQNGVSDQNNAGAGVHIEQGGKIVNCKIINNLAVDFGGGVYTRQGATIENCYIANNSANNGGGIFCANGGKVLNSIITQNTGVSGGGVVSYGGGEVINCIITGNSGTFGGGVYQGGGGTIVNCVIVGNNSSSRGGGMWSNYTQYGGPPSATINTIIWNNTSSGSEPEVSFMGTDNYAITNFSHCAIQDIASITWDYIVNSNNINLSSENNDVSGPNFTDPASGNYTLTSASPCINVGDNSYVLPYSLDYSANTRIQQGRVDLGANETAYGTFPTSFQRYFVTMQGNDANNGSSWSQAKQTVQVAVNSAAETILPETPVEIWVAEGTYTLASSVELKEGILIYGGFAGTESSLDERDWVENITTLDADASSVSRRSVVQYADISNASTCDGFSLVNGNVPGKGGAALLRENGLLKNCTINNNIAGLRGGGVYLYKGGKIQNCTLQSNSTLMGGGAYFYYGGEMINSILISDSAWVGGGVCTENGGSIRNCLFNNNTSGYIGAGASLSYGCDLINCTFSMNHSYQVAGGLYGEYNNQFGGVGLKIANTIFWNNSADVSDPQINLNEGNSHISFLNDAIQDINNVEFGSTVISGNINLSASNIATDGPNFSNPDENDFTLTESSPCVNSGDNTVIVDDVDLNGNTRIQGLIVDMGAYESSFVAGLSFPYHSESFVNVFPNPAINQVTVLLPGCKGVASIEVINTLGNTIKRVEVSVNNDKSMTTLNLSKVSSGTYFIKIIGNDYIKVVKCLKR